MKTPTCMVLLIACAASCLPPGIASARDRCALNDTSCRVNRLDDSSVRRGSSADISRERERQIRTQRLHQNRDRGANYGLPSPADVRPCQTRPIISGQGTRVVPTC